MELLPLPASFAVAPWRLSGVVYGALVNHAAQLAALDEAADAAPYKAPPQHPVLQVRPRNTLCGPGSAVAVPADPGVVELGVSLGIVIGRTACRVAVDEAPGVIAGYAIAAELGLPTDSHYRPAVRLKARDGFTVLGPVVPAAEVDDPDQLATWVQVNSEAHHQGSTAGRVRGVAELIAAVTEFMTLQPGDVLLLGADTPAPQAAAGAAVTLGIAGLGSLSFTLVPETAVAVAEPSTIVDGTDLPQRGAVARVAYAGAVHSARPHAQGLQLADGRVLRENEVQWLPPFGVGTILALGLNYADHLKELSKELTVTAKDEPLVFLKGPGALVGHRGTTRRPAGVAFMHYECELAVVIGKTAKDVAAKDAMAHVAGYTVCNDYEIGRASCRERVS
jgi:5-oxopent-3-ene-1,2,5-tricarboxylate decarboxylase/2-hydroxyhepta-2,4-diene-1,7-dioate isomerase